MYSKINSALVKGFFLILYLLTYCISLNAQIPSSRIDLDYPEGIKSISIIHVFKDSVKSDTSTEISTIYYSKDAKQDSIVKTYKGNYVYKEIWHRDSLNRYLRIHYNLDNNKISMVKEVIHDTNRYKLAEILTTFSGNKQIVTRSEFIYCSDSMVYKVTYKDDVLYSISRNQVLNRTYVVMEENCEIYAPISKEKINCEYLNILQISSRKNYDLKIVDGFIINTIPDDHNGCFELHYIINNDIVYKNHTQYDSSANMLSHSFVYESNDTVFTVYRYINDDEDVELYSFENFDKIIRYEYDYKKQSFNEIMTTNFQYLFDKNKNWVRRDEHNLEDNLNKITLRKIEYY